MPKILLLTIGAFGALNAIRFITGRLDTNAEAAVLCVQGAVGVCVCVCAAYFLITLQPSEIIQTLMTRPVFTFAVLVLLYLPERLDAWASQKAVKAKEA